MKKTLLSGIVASLLLIGAGISNAQDESHSSRPWRGEYKAIESASDYDALPKDTKMAMVCDKCKTVTFTTKKERSEKTGKSAEYTCPKCGGQSGFCCVMTHDHKK